MQTTVNNFLSNKKMFRLTRGGLVKITIFYHTYDIILDEKHFLKFMSNVEDMYIDSAPIFFVKDIFKKLLRYTDYEYDECKELSKYILKQHLFIFGL